MHIAAVVPLYPPHSLVGAWITTHECLRHLVANGHTVTVHAYRYRGDSYDLDGVTVHDGRQGRSHIDREVARADVIVCHGDDHHAVNVGPPVVRFVHGRQHVPLHRYPRCVDRFGSEALVVFPSHAFAAATSCDAPAIVVHPPIDPDRYRTTPGDAVTLVNLAEAKGGRLFWRLARVRPDTRFLGVLGGYGPQAHGRLANVDVVPTQPDMRIVYGRTRVLLMPSWFETFGRVAVEAMASGIPVIAHPTPGLVEALDPAGIIIDRGDAAGWLAAIDRLADPDEWAAASQLALARSSELAAQRPTDLQRFLTAVESIQHEGEPTS